MVIGLVILKWEVRYDFPASRALNYMDQEKEPAWRMRNGMVL